MTCKMTNKQRHLLIALRRALIVFLRALDEYLELPPTIPTRKQREMADNGRHYGGG